MIVMILKFTFGQNFVFIMYLWIIYITRIYFGFSSKLVFGTTINRRSHGQTVR